MEKRVRKEARVSSSVEDNNDEDVDDNVKTFNFERYLTYDILRIIFQYLNGVQLSKASMVCRLWMEAANSERKTRGPVYLKDQHNKTKAVKNLMIKPKLGLFFTAPSIPDDECGCHCKFLPSSCHSVSLGTYGIVMNKWEMEQNEEFFVCAFLPEIPNVSIKTFVLENRFHENSVTIKEIKDILEASPTRKQTECEKSKCLMLFCNGSGRHLAMGILESLKNGCAKQNLSLWGGIVNDLWVCNSENGKRNFCKQYRKFSCCVAVTLTGSGIKTWSIIVDHTCQTREQVEFKLKSFRERVQLKKYSMGFMFACCDRGVDMYSESNVESSIFKNIFPEVPLAGCFGDGEFGENSIPIGTPNRKRTKRFNQLSTVFLILTYG